MLLKILKRMIEKSHILDSIRDAQANIDEMIVDQEYRLTILELGV